MAIRGVCQGQKLNYQPAGAATHTHADTYTTTQAQRRQGTANRGTHLVALADCMLEQRHAPSKLELVACGVQLRPGGIDNVLGLLVRLL